MCDSNDIGIVSRNSLDIVGRSRDFVGAGN